MVCQTVYIGDANLCLYINGNYQDIDIDRTRPMVVICPGGCYSFCSNREAEAVAVRMLSYGYNAAVLFYSVAPGGSYFPKSVGELAKSVDYIRKHAGKLHTDPKKIVVLGFSAGGHLAATLGTMWNDPVLAEETGLDPKCYRPDALALGYPVITSGPYAHTESIKNLLGPKYDELREKVSLENQVTENTPPTFLWSTWNDETVPVQNTLLFATALKEHNVSCEMHIFSKGSHGLSLANNEVASFRHPECAPSVQIWPELFRVWLDDLFGLTFYGGKAKK